MATDIDQAALRVDLQTIKSDVKVLDDDLVDVKKRLDILERQHDMICLPAKTARTSAHEEEEPVGLTKKLWKKVEKKTSKKQKSIESPTTPSPPPPESTTVAVFGQEISGLGPAEISEEFRPADIVLQTLKREEELTPNTELFPEIPQSPPDLRVELSINHFEASEYKPPNETSIQNGYTSDATTESPDQEQVDQQKQDISAWKFIGLKKLKSDSHLVSNAYCARVSKHLPGDPVIVAFLQGVTVRQQNGQLVIDKIADDSPILKRGLAHVGDSIMEVNGVTVQNEQDLRQQLSNKDAVTLKIVPSGLESAPSLSGDFVKCCFDYDPSKDDLIPTKQAGLSFKLGDILQIIDKEDPDWWQARKVNDWSYSGLIPSRMLEEKRKAAKASGSEVKEKKRFPKKLLYSSKHSADFDENDIKVYEDVCKQTPYGRKVLVLIGASGVGRRTLKARILQHDRENFATITPHTSRKPKEGEVDGREYHFESKEKLKKEIDQGKFLEFGEYNGNMYGTKFDSIKAVIKTGKVCVLDCSPQAIKHLYTRDYMPFVVFLAPPAFDEFRQICQLYPSRNKPKTDEDLKRICYETTLLEQQYKHLFDLVLVNRNVEVAFRRLYDAMESLKIYSQWVPTFWLFG